MILKDLEEIVRHIVKSDFNFCTFLKMPLINHLRLPNLKIVDNGLISIQMKYTLPNRQKVNSLRAKLLSLHGPEQ